MGTELLLLAALVMAHTTHAATVLITGANSGVGLEFARQYAAAGWTVIATHRHESTPDSLAALTKQYPNVRVERLDVTRVAEMDALIDHIDARLADAAARWARRVFLSGGKGGAQPRHARAGG
jgi:NAD(P)-dependent dehydrogenase (short-subunit alcohol dehydrogenase family)